MGVGTSAGFGSPDSGEGPLFGTTSWESTFFSNLPHSEGGEVEPERLLWEWNCGGIGCIRMTVPRQVQVRTVQSVKDVFEQLFRLEEVFFRTASSSWCKNSIPFCGIGMHKPLVYPIYPEIRILQLAGL